MTAPPPVTPRPPTILHAALLTGAVVVAGGLAALRAAVPPGDIGAIAPLLRWVLFGMTVVELVLLRVFKARVVPLAAGSDRVAWWRTHQVAAILIWGMCEGMALAGGVFYYLTGDWVTLGLVAVWLVVLWWQRPGRLMEG